MYCAANLKLMTKTHAVPNSLSYKFVSTTSGSIMNPCLGGQLPLALSTAREPNFLLVHDDVLQENQYG